MSHHPGTFPDDDLTDNYTYTYTPPHRGLSVRRSLIHERSTYELSPSPSPPPQVQEPVQAYYGSNPQSQSLLHQQSGNLPRRVPVGSGVVSKWGASATGEREREREGAYESVPSGDIEADLDIERQQPQPQPQPHNRRKSKSKSRSRSPKKKDRSGVGVIMTNPQQDNTMAGAVAGVATSAGEQRTQRFFHPVSHPDSSFTAMREHRQSIVSLRDQYDPHHDDAEFYEGNHSQQQGRLQGTGGAGGAGEGYSPSTSSARGFALAGAPVGRSVTPEVLAGQYPPPNAPQQQQQGQYTQGENTSYYNQGSDYPYPTPPQQYFNNNHNNDFDTTPLPPPPPLPSAVGSGATGSRTGSTTSLHATAALAGLPPPNAPHLTHHPHTSNTSLHSHSSATSRRRSLPPAPAAAIPLIPPDDSPYKRFSGLNHGSMASTTALGIDGQIDVNLLDENDPDDGLATPPPPGGHTRGHGILTGLRGGKAASGNNSGVFVGAAGVGAAGVGAGAGVLAADQGGLLDGSGHGGVNTTAPFGEGIRGLGGGGSGLGGGGGGSGGSSGHIMEKESDWLASQKHSKQKSRKIAIIILILLVLAIVGGVTAGVLLSKKHSSSNSDGGSSSNDSSTKTNSDGSPKSSTDSNKWKSYLNNPALHRVFHGIDYTPLNALYPECLDTPPTQAQINIDLAIMSQLTTRIRLYGTDCNQAEMVLDGIKTTGVDVKIWLGVWLDYNSTTNARSLQHMYDILGKYDKSMFEGVVIGNEVLFRNDLTTTELSTVLKDIKTNLTNQGIDLPIGTSDLGSKWTSQLASAVDVLMANIHPFFGGVDVNNASTWTMEFFDKSNLPISTAAKIRGMISEVGWPTGGGTLQGSVAGISELNKFLGDWVCQRNKQGIEYFWFSAFDEPWKTRYNEPGKEWEDKWGLLDAQRKVKQGVSIPSCN